MMHEGHEVHLDKIVLPFQHLTNRRLRRLLQSLLLMLHIPKLEIVPTTCNQLPGVSRVYHNLRNVLLDVFCRDKFDFVKKKH